jgi:hypothetical protein
MPLILRTIDNIGDPLCDSSGNILAGVTILFELVNLNDRVTDAWDADWTPPSALTSTTTVKGAGGGGGAGYDASDTITNFYGGSGGYSRLALTATPTVSIVTAGGGAGGIQLPEINLTNVTM